MSYDILLIGGDGDLAIRKLYPALITLESAGQLANVATITALSRSSGDRDALLKRIHESPLSTGSDGFCDDSWQRFQERFRCLQGDASDAKTFAAYQATLGAASKGVIVYLAVPPKVFGGACRALKTAGLAVPSTRLVVEKPLGFDRESFVQLNKEMRDGFDESQIYRIDHYLGKESVQNLLALRFANQMFGSIWNGSQMDHVQITLAERVGVEGRQNFYDDVGALRDMVQNHLLQVLCLVAMEPPANRTPEMIRVEKYKVLKSLKTLSGEDAKRYTVRGQYREGTMDGEVVPAYQQEMGGERPSDTETFVAIRAEIDNWRWAGVPFYLRTGKRMQVRTSEILVQFKSPKHNIFGEAGQTLIPNQLRIRLQPDAGVQLHFLSKRPGLGDVSLEEQTLDLSAPESHHKHSYDAYARMMLEVLHGDQTMFVSAEEVEASWGWIDEIIDQWELNGIKPKPYAAGSSGPLEAGVMIAQDGREWSTLDV
ncbi:MAG: glucose-6-phosphate dehydrogenase [Cellvibrionaceae bacterium]|nr:glucose-6-phosphate dehydrogenase [Cellvibrionaceae bacterium]